eukprot:Rhum_TRINITY_DN14763_c9_g1::Rhum_TRINITY_DN14763_c9_g1_i1::g.110926::m.110926
MCAQGGVARPTGVWEQQGPTPQQAPHTQHTPLQARPVQPINISSDLYNQSRPAASPSTLLQHPQHRPPPPSFGQPPHPSHRHQPPPPPPLQQQHPPPPPNASVYAAPQPGQPPQPAPGIPPHSPQRSDSPRLEDALLPQGGSGGGGGGGGGAAAPTETLASWLLNEVPTPPLLTVREKAFRAVLWLCAALLFFFLLFETLCVRDHDLGDINCDKLPGRLSNAYRVVVGVLFLVFLGQVVTRQLSTGGGLLHAHKASETRRIQRHLDDKIRFHDALRACLTQPVRGWVSLTHHTPPNPLLGQQQQPQQQQQQLTLQQQQRRQPSGDAAVAAGRHVTQFEPVVDWAAVAGSVRDAGGRIGWGNKMREACFELKPLYLNSASYGATPRCVMKAKDDWDGVIQANPSRFMKDSMRARVERVAARVAKLVNANEDDLVLTTNANQATSCILKSIPWVVGDRIFILSVDYDATKLATTFLRRISGIEVIEHDLPLPQTHQEVVASVRAKLEELKRQKALPCLANFCHVTSKTAWIFPAKELTALFHSFGVPVIIDGAQAAGHLDLDLRSIGADWYLGTVHKWMYSCQGVAFLCTTGAKKPLTKPLDISETTGGGSFKDEYYASYHANLDFATWLSVDTALDFVEKVCGGWESVRGYCRSQAAQCVALLKAEWGTDAAQTTQDYYGNMPIMPLPKGDGLGAIDAAKVMAYLGTKDITAFLLCASFGGVTKLCVRCSCQIYTDMSDWRKLASAVNALGGNYGAGSVVATMLGGGSQPKKATKKKGKKVEDDDELNTRFS